MTQTRGCDSDWGSNCDWPGLRLQTQTRESRHETGDGRRKRGDARRLTLAAATTNCICILHNLIVITILRSMHPGAMAIHSCNQQQQQRQQLQQLQQQQQQLSYSCSYTDTRPHSWNQQTRLWLHILMSIFMCMCEVACVCACECALRMCVRARSMWQCISSLYHSTQTKQNNTRIKHYPEVCRRLYALHGI